jgi:hypothetical protein
MSEDAVGKALEAACRTDPLYGATPGGDADIRRDRADAVAAFLRALPGADEYPAYCDDVGLWSLADLAGFVTRAASEDTP